MQCHALDALLEGHARLLRSPLPQPERSDGVPRVRAALARVQVPAGFVRQLPLELGQRLRFVAAGKMYQPAEPMEGDGAEPRMALRLRRLTRDARGQLAFRFVERLPRYVHCGGKPVCERKPW